MSKGIVYCMKSIVTPGLVKIGKTTNLKNRSNDLKDGYKNVALEMHFAIEVDNYDEKEEILKDTFEYCCLKTEKGKLTELFAVNINKVMDLMLCFEGKQVFPNPKETSKKELFKEAIERVDAKHIPNGIYELNKRGVKARMKINYGNIIICKGSQLSSKPTNSFFNGRNKAIGRNYKELLKTNVTSNGIFVDDYDGFTSVSRASSVITGSSDDGWKTWKNSNNESIDIYRKIVE